MKQWPTDLEKIMHSPEAKNLMQNKEKINALSNSPEVKKMLETLQKKMGQI